jgi:hypothetical protein
VGLLVGEKRKGGFNGRRYLGNERWEEEMRFQRQTRKENANLETWFLSSGIGSELKVRC